METNTMKAAVVREFGKPLVLERRPIPAPGPGEVLVRIHASGVCHTDVHAADGDWPVRPKPPFIPGHEGAGIVQAVGPGVMRLRTGDRVGIAWLHEACGWCTACVGGWETLCPQQQNSGYGVDGCYAEFALARADYAVRIPDALSFPEAAPILCAGVTTYKGLKETEARPGQWVAISGIGGLGHVAVQYAVAMGLHVAAIDVNDGALELARRFGAELIVNARREEPAATVQKATGGVHASLVTAVSTPAFAAGIGMLRPGGTCVLVGLPPGDFPAPIFDLVLKRLTIRGSIVGTRNDLAEALALAAEGKVRASLEQHPLADVNGIFDRLRSGRVQGRVVLDLSER
jgi:alcohol dehydrogenase, propanol-preferring